MNEHKTLSLLKSREVKEKNFGQYISTNNCKENRTLTCEPSTVTEEKIRE